jgi:hypothetical protein
LIIAGAAAGAAALVARLADPDELVLRLLEGVALLLAASAYLAHLLSHRPSRQELILRLGLVTAFALWAIVQLFPAARAAATINDGAIILFIGDLALVLSPWRLDAE